MHPLNPYASELPDFAALCRADEQLAQLVGWSSSSSGSTQQRSPFIDFANAEVLRRITEATLEHDFGVTARLRDDRLCPPVPNRLNYIAWIAELLEACHLDELAGYVENAASQSNADSDLVENGPRKRRKNHTPARSTVRILDIGTGASCIYPLLGCALYPEWHFVATDVDEVSIKHARGILDDPRNNEAERDGQGAEGTSSKRRGARQQTDTLMLRSTVHLIHRKPEEPLLLDEQTVSDVSDMEQLHNPMDQDGKNPHLLYHASMCNPPFYTSAEDMKASLDGKSAPPSAVQHGAAVEMLYEGGEVAFINRMVDESIGLGARVIWFTTMLGKLSSVAPVVDMLKQGHIKNFYITELVQGATRRWAVAWTLTSFRVPQPMVSVSSALLTLQPPAGRHAFSFDVAAGEVLSYVREQLIQRSYYCVATKNSQAEDSLLVYVARDTWSRKARRQQQLQSNGRGSGAADDSLHVPGVPALGLRICRIASAPKPSLEALWVFGHDRQLFDSFAMSVLGSLLTNGKPKNSEARTL